VDVGFRARINRRRLIGGLLAAASATALAGCAWLDPLKPPASPTAGPSGTPLAGGGPTPRPGASPTAAPIAVVAGPPSGYLAVAPRTFRAGQREMVSVSLFRDRQPTTGTVHLAIVKDGRPVAQASAQVQGRGDVPVDVPAKAAEGDYQLQLTAGSFQDQSPVRVEDGTLLFLESDKPIYKPGQTIHFRVLTLDPQLRPVASSATVDLSDAKGLKVYKKEAETDEYGMATLDVPLSTEPNLGVWKATARAGKRTAQLDVRVERYVLPKYEVKVSLPKDWVLASEQIAGTVSAEYSYGKPVRGEVQIKATRYVGSWQEFASASPQLDAGGKAEFKLPPAQYVAGVPGVGGMGNVTLEVTVREKSTGYEEKTSKLLAVAATPTVLRVIPESVSFKPGLPLSLLILAETPDGKPVDASVRLDLAYTKGDFNRTRETQQVAVKGGKALLKVTPPSDAISLTLGASADRATTSLVLQSGYSPSGTFVHVEQTSTGVLKVGDRAKFHVTATREANSFYYEVVARGSVIYSDVSKSPDVEVGLTPQMAPLARLLVYQILPTSEVAADYVPFSVEGKYPQNVQVAFSREEVKPGEAVDVSVQTEGQARVGLAAVDRSVFILAENRLNLQQVFDELERLYQRPQAELHSLGQPAGPMPGPVAVPAQVAPGAPARPGVAPVAPMPADPFAMGKVTTRGAKEVFGDAGVVVLSNQQVPAGKEYQAPQRALRALEAVGAGVPAAAPAATANPAAQKAAEAPRAAAADRAGDADLAEVQRVRQLFPETWLWETFATDGGGKATRRVEAPDSITTWMLRAVALSKAAGLGVGETQLRVLQPFFVQVDLPYAAIRGEEFPVKVALYNYQAQPEEFVVELEKADWFDLLDPASARVQVGPNDLGSASFKIRPSKLGVNKLKVTARSPSTADAIVKELIVEPEGVQREVVENLVLSAAATRQLDVAFPDGVIEGSPRAYIALTGSYLTQTIEGLEGLLKMPFGCGEQNMILFAPNVFVTRYLKETGQTKPEVMAKAEHLMITGYQRELTYRRGDGSFSAFGNSDKEGSLWLTAFVLKTFAQAKDVIFVDDAVLASSKAWIGKQQKADGSFEPVGFVHHQELLGGLSGKTALTAYLAIALKEAGDDAASARAVRYLEGALDSTEDPYALAIGTYALGLAKSQRAAKAADRLLKLAKESDDGLSWGEGPREPEPAAKPAPGLVPPRPPRPNQSAAIETTSYALLAFLEKGDRLTASRAARWLVSRRNAYGGFGSTQDTVVGLQALTKYASTGRADVDATVRLRAGTWQKEARVAPQNADVLQIFEVPLGGPVSVEVAGKGQVVLQSVRRFNVPDAAERRQSVFQLKVDYGTAQVDVDDLIDVTATVRYTPPEPIPAGMVVLDVAVPTGFAPETPTLDDLAKRQAKVKRYDVAGRKVVFYVEDMAPEEEITLSFKARALYPVRAQAVASQAYSYYRPDWKGESLGGALVVRGS